MVARHCSSAVAPLACVTVRHTLLASASASLRKSSIVTAESQRILRMWHAVKAELKEAEADGDKNISIAQTKQLHAGLSTQAQLWLQELDETELTAVQVLIGTSIGLKPRRSPLKLGSTAENVPRSVARRSFLPIRAGD